MYSTIIFTDGHWGLHGTSRRALMQTAILKQTSLGAGAMHGKLLPCCPAHLEARLKVSLVRSQGRSIVYHLSEFVPCDPYSSLVVSVPIPSPQSSLCKSLPSSRPSAEEHFPTSSCTPCCGASGLWGWFQMTCFRCLKALWGIMAWEKNHFLVLRLNLHWKSVSERG